MNLKLHTSPEVEAVLLIARAGTFAEPDLDPAALAKCRAKGWVTPEGEPLALLPDGIKAIAALKL